ncbi:MAG: hypothetical protein HQK63_07395 [Desulfamplus sp.]|nr:hypothetical protein [Desulfamplus sp.]MBF0229400.1 hypothetical protein [Desulfamplus sp.]
MQKLLERDTYTPLNASQVQCNCDSVLNKEDTLSVQNLKTFDNNPDVNLPQNTEGFNSNYVFILVSAPEQVQGFSPVNIL